MNFLQKRKGLHDAAHPVEGARNGRSKDKARQTEEEISAYFTPVRPASRERQTARGTPKILPSKSKVHRSQTDPTRYDVSDHSLTRSLGSRGALAGAVRAQSASATYYSWSTSAAGDVRPLPKQVSPLVDSRPLLAHSHVASVSIADDHGPGRGVRSRSSSCPAQVEHAPKERDRISKQKPTGIPSHRSSEVRHGALGSKGAREGRGRVKQAFIGRDDLRSEQLPEASGSLTMPSSPPFMGIDKLMADPRPHETPKRSEHESTAEPAAGVQSSSTPLDSLLHKCNEALASHFSEDWPAGFAYGEADEQPAQTQEQEDEAFQPVPQNIRPAEAGDMRRAWRVSHLTDVYETGRTDSYYHCHGDIGSRTVTMACHRPPDAEFQDGRILEEQPLIAGFCGTRENGNVFQWEQEEEDSALTTAYGSGDFEDDIKENFEEDVLEEEDDDDGIFWQPNILY